jgi:hypothetical protein
MINIQNEQAAFPKSLLYNIPAHEHLSLNPSPRREGLKSEEKLSMVDHGGVSKVCFVP